jgi:hypothetical protein
MEAPHQPAIYSTTKQFLDFLGLHSLDQLPSPQEYVDLSEESKRKFKQKLGEAADDEMLSGIRTGFGNEEQALREGLGEGDALLGELHDALLTLTKTDDEVAHATGLKPQPQPPATEPGEE